MQILITYTLYFLTIFLPLTFTTFNSELFEFPKFILLLSGTILISLAWGYHIYQTKVVPSIKVNALNLSVLAILFSQTISTIFSIHPYTSFWGYYSRFHQGLLTTLCYTIIYFSAQYFLNNKSTQKLIKISVGTAFLISLYAILERLGIDKTLWIQDVQNRVFSTLGQPNWLAAYLLPNLFLILYLHQTSRAKNTSPLHNFIYTTLFVALLFTKSRSGFLAFLLSYITYFILLARQFSFPKIRPYAIRYTLYTILLIALFGSPFSPSIFSILGKSQAPASPLPTGTVLETGGTESGDIRKIVWTGALDLIKKYPLFGTGPETFAYSYYWTRPISHNNTSEWDFLYNKAHNEYLNIAATTGLIGLVAYLYFHYAVFATSLTTIPKSKKVNQDADDSLRHFYPVLGASIIGFSVTNFFGFSVIPVYLTMILLATIPATLIAPTILNQVPSTMYYVLIILPLIYPAKLFLADLNYAQGKRLLDAGNSAKALPLLKRAVAARPGSDVFHSALGETYATLGQADLANQQADLLRTLNPYHLNYYKSRAKIYLTLNENEPAKNELIKARELAPTDPKLAYNLGLVETRLGQNEEAAQQLRDAIALKPNYESPYYALTLLYEQTKQEKLIPDLLKQATQNLATYSGQLKAKIEKYQ